MTFGALGPLLIRPLTALLAHFTALPPLHRLADDGTPSKSTGPQPEVKRLRSFARLARSAGGYLSTAPD